VLGRVCSIVSLDIYRDDFVFRKRWWSHNRKHMDLFCRDLWPLGRLSRQRTNRDAVLSEGCGTSVEIRSTSSNHQKLGGAPAKSTRILPSSQVKRIRTALEFDGRPMTVCSQHYHAETLGGCPLSSARGPLLLGTPAITLVPCVMPDDNTFEPHLYTVRSHK
jgi:hypothetical protein